MGKVRVLIAAAGRGTRSGLTYPKTLFPIFNIPILVRLIRLFLPYDKNPIVIVSKDGLDPIQKCLQEHSLSAQLIVQNNPRGMGDAVLCLKQLNIENIMLVWGDVPFIQNDTVSSLVKYYFNHNSDFAFVTKEVDLAYTMVMRDKDGDVSKVLETRENSHINPQSGERDIGLFIFKMKAVFSLLAQDLPGKFGLHTGEHGFLYIIEHMVLHGYRVDALKIATELDIVSFNSMDDITLYLQ